MRTEIVASGIRLHVGPEPGDEVFAWLWFLLEGKIGQESGRFLTGKAGSDLLALYQAQRAEEFDTTSDFHNSLAVTPVRPWGPCDTDSFHR